jgi:carbonic anhydrase/acetyltransferase-like protein (isoleucine patch superfamily)
MKMYIYRTGTTLQPFGDDVSQAQVLLETLEQAQARACKRHKLELVRIDRPSEATERPCLLAPDYVFFTEKVLGDFVKTAKETGVKGAALALDRCVSVEHTLPLQDLVLLDWGENRGRAVYDLWMVPEGSLPDDPSEVRKTLKGRCPPLTVPMREVVRAVRLPVLDKEEQFFKYPFTSTVCCHLSHWTHLLWLSQLALGITWNEYMRNHMWRAIGKAIWAVLRKCSFNRWKFFSGMNIMGKGCDVHPTAYTEFSVLGKGVKVGAGACIRNSLIGDKVIIADHAVVVNSVVGSDCYLTENFFLVSSLCYPGSTLGNLKTQMAVIGREVYLHGWCSLLDAKFVGDIKVMHRGERVGTGRSFMASCIGHRAVLGAKVLIHPGREIPNDMLMVSRPEDVIAEVPQDIPARTPMVRDQGTLVTLESLKTRGKV